MGRGLDDVDRGLAAALQEDARQTNAELGRCVGLAPSSAHERIRRMEEGGHIRGYHARLNPGSFDLGVTAYVFVDAGDIASESRVGEGLKGIPGVQEIHHIAGEDCFLVKIWAEDTGSLGKRLRSEFAAAGAQSTRTTIVLETILESAGIPLNVARATDAGADDQGPSLPEPAP